MGRFNLQCVWDLAVPFGTQASLSRPLNRWKEIRLVWKQDKCAGKPHPARMGAGPMLSPRLYSNGTRIDFRMILPVSTNSITRRQI